MNQYFSAGVMLAIGAVLLVLAFGFLDSGGVEVDEENVLMWDDYREIDDTSGILGTNGAIEIVTVGGTTYVHAKDTGYGTIVYENGRNTEYKVERATADIVIMNGQSNAAYYRKNALPPEADKAPAPKIGTSYYFGQLTDPKINYQIQSIEGYRIYDLIDPETGVLRLGDKGPEFCKEYTETTGHKAIWLSMGIIAKRVSEWLPPSGSCWQYDLGFMEAFNEQLEQLPIDVDRTIMMWAQGESDKNAGTSIDTYKQRFMTFYEAAPSAWGHDIDACYMIQGRTAKMGTINTALAQLAEEHDDIKLAVPASLIDTFSIENGLMYSDDLHYEQQGENAISNAAARFVLKDLGHGVTDSAPIYLMQAEASAEVGGTYTPPGFVTLYKTDLSQARAAVAWDSTPGTSQEGTFTAYGSASVAPSLILPYAYPPMLIVTVVPPATPETHTVSFAVATDSIGYGSVSIASLADVVDGTTATIGQTIVVGSAGQCTAMPASATSQYTYSFAGWTGADDSSTQAPTTITADTTYYAHFTRTVQTYTVTFAVASDSTGYGTVSVQSVQGVPYGTSVSIAQTIAVGAVGQCTATPASATSQYTYSFSGWTGADDSSTQAPTVISGNTAYYAHFSRTLLPMDPSLFTYTTVSGEQFVEGWAGTPPADGYDLYLPDTDGQGHQLYGVIGNNSSGFTSRFAGASTLKAPSVVQIATRAFKDCALLTDVSLPATAIIYSFAFQGCTAIERVEFGPLTTLGSSDSFPNWTFYDTDGTTVLSKTAANLANSTFQGTASALIKVPAGAKSLSPEMEKKAVELATENELKARMLAALDVDGMDPDEIAKMTIKEIAGLSKADVEKLKAEIQAKRLAETKEETI